MGLFSSQLNTLKVACVVIAPHTKFENVYVGCFVGEYACVYVISRICYISLIPIYRFRSNKGQVLSQYKGIRSHTVL